ncbi:MAG: hypothetical protein EOM90_08160 [Alphaproteobacteria bacterium]|nr:hypothetical protein [Alphaproteobacteria bacterium]
MNRFFVLLVSILLPAFLYAQDLPYQKGLEPASLTPDELFVLSNVPPLEVPALYLGADAPLLPVSVDNSTQPYFRPITQQSGYECGQSAGICFNFTYEIDRLRGIPANVGANQYPSHFTWNFLNNANNYQGASFFDSWEIVRRCGNMNVTDYGGGLNTGGYTRWISGYDKYHNGMANRLNSVKSIRVDSPEGLQTLKYWLVEHLEGASVGGVANFYGQFFGTPSTTLPAGTPEAGKYVQTNWGGSPSHAWTICGYNDSIRYDFNGDGQYTNNIDINNDGVVNMKDWEKGGLKFANGYSGTGWSNSGFCYTMYKNLADNIGYGGIWNHSVYVLDVKYTCDPQLTMKVTLKHTSRNKLKVTAGISLDLSATQPAYVLEFPIFAFQGGDLYMQGGTTEADKTIEFGFDLAPLLQYVTSSVPVRYFLQVQEKDPSGVASGEIVNWSVIDYTGGTPVIANYPTNNVAIQNNTTTRLALNYNLVINKPVITTGSLPAAQLYQPYSVTLQAANGTPPYKWDAKLDYPESTQGATLPIATAQQLTLTNNNTGYAIKALDFSFPFYKKTVQKLYIYADGYIVFDDQPYTYPYLIDRMLLFRQTPILAPFMADLAIYPSSSQGVWYEGNANYAIVRWKASINNMPGSTELNFAVKLYPNGVIEYYYGTMNFPGGTTWTGGLSSGDNKNYQFSSLNGASTVTANTLDKFASCSYPPEMTISEDGHFSGTPIHSYQNLPIKFIVTDNNNITSTKTMIFSSFGLLVSQSVTSGGDSLIEFGETAKMSLTVNNIGTVTMNNLIFTIRENDPYITITDSSATVPQINGGQNITLNNAFTFTVAPDIPDNHEFSILMKMQSLEQTFQRPLPMKAHAPVFQVTSTELRDGDNGMPDPGESADLLVTYKNAGSAKVSDVAVTLNSVDTVLNLTINTGSIDLLQPDSSRTLTFHLKAGPTASFEHLYPIAAHLTANNNFSVDDTLYLFSGTIVEDFETGDLLKFPWFGTGQWPWYMEPTVKYEGWYSIRSGYITDNAESILNLTARVLAPGTISFYRYISCEQDPSGNKNYDYLTFTIDGYELGRWDGIEPWTLESYPVSPGLHTFSWTYHKDYSQTAGWDCALLDFIKLPVIEGLIPQITVQPAFLEKSVATGQSISDTLSVSNAGGGIIHYSVIVIDTGTVKKNMLPDNLTGSWAGCDHPDFTPGQTFNWICSVRNLSADNEYINHVRFDFPPGIEVTGATNFSGGSLGELTFQGIIGNGTSLAWHGETTAGRGVLKPGETAYATVTGVIGPSFQNDAFIVYQLQGDSMGGSPHTATGHFKVENLGLGNNWLTLNPVAGSVLHGETDEVEVTLNAAGMAPNHSYNCLIVARDLYNNSVTVPVTMHVTFPVSVDGKDLTANTRLLGNQPNPFSGETRIRYLSDKPQEILFEIRSMEGTLLRSWSVQNSPTGENYLVWDGNNDAGNRVLPGIYICLMKTADRQEAIKMVVIR